MHGASEPLMEARWRAKLLEGLRAVQVERVVEVMCTGDPGEKMNW
jgi:hypothetical protein